MDEWTEESYLEPDLLNGMAYLEAIRDCTEHPPGRNGNLSPAASALRVAAVGRLLLDEWDFRTTPTVS